MLQTSGICVRKQIEIQLAHQSAISNADGRELCLDLTVPISLPEQRLTAYASISRIAGSSASAPPDTSFAFGTSVTGAATTISMWHGEPCHDMSAVIDAHVLLSNLVGVDLETVRHQYSFILQCWVQRTLP